MIECPQGVLARVQPSTAPGFNRYFPVLLPGPVCVWLPCESNGKYCIFATSPRLRIRSARHPLLVSCDNRKLKKTTANVSRQSACGLVLELFTGPLADFLDFVHQFIALIFNRVTSSVHRSARSGFNFAFGNIDGLLRFSLCAIG